MHHQLSELKILNREEGMHDNEIGKVQVLGVAELGERDLARGGEGARRGAGTRTRDFGLGARGKA